MQIIVSHLAKNRKRSILYYMKNNLRFSPILNLNVRVEHNITQVLSLVILQDQTEISEDAAY